MTTKIGNEETPAALGFRLPAEWEPHEATWFAWPVNKRDWPGKYAPIPWAAAEIVRLVSRFEPVKVIVPNRKVQERAESKLDRAGARLDRVEFVRLKTERSWLRDSGPIFIVNDRLEKTVCLDWKFNAWAKYDNHAEDDRLARRLAKRLSLERIEPVANKEGETRRLVLEGGAIDTNGRGTILVVEECLLSDVQCRNPGLSREDLERAFADYLACGNVVWLDRGIVGDDTHGHVDDLARFVDPRTIVAAVERDPNDANFEALRINLKRLRAARDADGRPFHVVELPMPRPLFFEGIRLPASYANFYVANGLTIVPTFNDPNDREALKILADLFPEREVVGVHALDLVWGLGTLHCLTRDQPAV